jgi:integrase
MKPIADYLKTYNRPKSIQGRSTAVRRFLSYLYPGEVPVPTPGEPVDLAIYEPVAGRFLEEVKTGKALPVNTLTGFVNSLSEMSPMGQHGYLSGAISFLEYHGIELSPADRKKIKRRAPPNQAITREDALAREQIIKILNHSTMQMKALIMVLCSSGTRLGETLQLTLEDLEDGDPMALHIPKEISKNKLPRTTYITSEAAGILREWLKYRPEYIGKKKGPREFTTGKDDVRLFPFNDSAATDMFILSLKKAGLYKKDRSTNHASIHLHSLRKWFRSNLVKAGGNALDVTEILMGHAGYLTRAYVRLTDEEIQKFYRENEHHLFIHPGTSEKDREKLETLAEENTRLRERMQAIETATATQEALIRLIDSRIVNSREEKK